MLSIFRKREEPPIGAASQALRDHIAKTTAVREKWLRLAEKEAAAMKTMRDAENAAAAVAALQAAVDAEVADAGYEGRAPVNLYEKEKQLTAATAEHRRLATQGRAANVVRTQYAEQRTVLNDQLAKLNHQTTRLLWETCLEIVDQHAEEFEAAAAALDAVARKAFAAAVAADQIALKHGYGQFCGSGLYWELKIPRPERATYRQPPPLIEGIVEKEKADGRALHKAAEDLIHTLLTGEER